MAELIVMLMILADYTHPIINKSIVIGVGQLPQPAENQPTHRTKSSESPEQQRANTTGDKTWPKSEKPT